MFALACCTTAACRGDVRDHLAWGDRLLGAGRTEEALAEYQLALRRRGDEPDVLLRVAHGYARMDRLDEASQYYLRLLDVDSAAADQAVADFLAMAKRALGQNDRARFARALEQLQSIRPGGVPDELALPFARYYYDLDEFARALPLYLSVVAAVPDSLSAVAEVPDSLSAVAEVPDSLSAVAEVPDSLSAVAAVPEGAAPEVRYELGRVYYELGECEQALSHFRAFLESRPEGQLRDDARWHAGRCAYRLAQEDLLEGRPSKALGGFELVIELRSPQALLDDAWFERGEVLFGLGEFDEALRSYRRVLDLNPSRTGRRVRTAEDRIRTIRYRGAPEEGE